MAIKVRQEINIFDSLQSSLLAAAVNPEGRIYLDSSIYSGSVSFYFEIVANNTSTSLESVYLRNSNGGDEKVVDIPASTANFTRIRSSSFIPNDTYPVKYTILTATDFSDAVQIKSARIIILQDCGVSNLTATSSQFEIGNDELWASEVINNPLTYPKYWKYESAKWDGTADFYFHFSAAVEVAMDYGAYNLQVDNGSFGGWANVFGSDFQVVSETPIYVGDFTATYKFTPIDGRHYRVVIHNENDMNAVMIYNAKIICKQTDAEITKLQTEYLIANTKETVGTGLKDYDTYFVPAEWEDISNSYYHEHYASGASSNTKLQEDPNGVPADITNSSITGANLQRGSAMTMPVAAEEIDVNVVAIS